MLTSRISSISGWKKGVYFALQQNYPPKTTPLQSQDSSWLMKKELGMKQKREHSRGAHLGCKQGGLKWRVLILGGDDVAVDCQK